MILRRTSWLTRYVTAAEPVSCFPIIPNRPTRVKAFFWTKIRKNRDRYSASRGIKEEQVTTILREDVIIDGDSRLGLDKLMALPGFEKSAGRLLQETERHHVNNHLKKYVDIYLPETPFEIATTNRYTINVEEAAVIARRDIRKGEIIRHLTGIQVTITPDEEKNLDLTRRDFSIVMSSRRRMPSLFLGPARFANHDCDANARLQTKGPSGMYVQAAKHIRQGDEITVSYGENYFGPDNCECLCATCESKCRNGWALPEDGEDSSPAGGEDLAQRLNTPRASRGRNSRIEPETSTLASADQAVLGSGDPSATKRTAEEANLTEPGRSARQSDSFRLVETTDRDSDIRPSREWDTGNAPSLKRKLDDFESHERPGRPSKRAEMADGRAIATVVDGDRARSASNPAKSTEDSGYVSVAGSTGSHDPKAAADVPEMWASSKDSVPSRFNVVTRDGNSTSILDARKRMQVSSILNVDGNSSPRPITDTPSRAVGLAGGSSNVDMGSKLHSSNVALPYVAKPDSRSSSTPGGDSTSSAPRPVPSVSQRITSWRRPGDYTLTGLLLAEPYSRWVECQVCAENFVQCNAFQTRHSCPRCERHSKLYGFKWPKTMNAADEDEERILDPREIDRFVDPSEEKGISKGKNRALKKLKDAREADETRSESNTEPLERTKNGRTFRANLGMRQIDDYDFGIDSPPRKKAKHRKPEEQPSSSSQKLQSKMAKGAKKSGHSNLSRNDRVKIVKPGQKSAAAKKNYRDPNRPKRRYRRTGLYSRDPEVREAAEKRMRLQNAQAEAEEKARRRREEKEKKEAERRAAKIASMKKPARPSPRWKGYILEPVTSKPEAVKEHKLYTPDGKRWEPEEEDEEEDEDDAQTRTPRPKRTIKPTAKSSESSQTAKSTVSPKTAQSKGSPRTAKSKESPRTARSSASATRSLPGSSLRNHITIDDSDDDDEGGYGDPLDDFDDWDSYDDDVYGDDDSYDDYEEGLQGYFDQPTLGIRRPGEAGLGMPQLAQLAQVPDSQASNESAISDEDEEMRESDSDWGESDVEMTEAPRSTSRFRRQNEAPAMVTRRTQRLSSSATPSSHNRSREASSSTHKMSKPDSKAAAAKKAGLPKGWAWPGEHDLQKRQQIDADKEAREAAVRSRRKTR